MSEVAAAVPPAAGAEEKAKKKKYERRSRYAQIKRKKVRIIHKKQIIRTDKKAKEKYIEKKKKAQEEGKKVRVERRKKEGKRGLLVAKKEGQKRVDWRVVRAEVDKIAKKKREEKKEEVAKKRAAGREAAKKKKEAEKKEGGEKKEKGKEGGEKKEKRKKKLIPVNAEGVIRGPAGRRGFKVDKIKNAKTKKTTGGDKKRRTQIKNLVGEIAGHQSYERRLLEMLKNGFEKRALKHAKKRLGSIRRAKQKREELSNHLRSLRK